MEFAGSVAAITGAAGGIGFALAQEAVRRGMAVAISDIRSDALQNAREALAAMGGQVLAVRADVTMSADVEAFAAATVEHFGKTCRHDRLGGSDHGLSGICQLFDDQACRPGPMARTSP